MTEEIQATQCRFIKLGSKGDKWEKNCITGAKPSIRLGFDNPHHADCLAGRWDVLEEYWVSKKTKGVATNTLNVIRDFYTLERDALWITFYDRKLWWCFAETEVTEVEPGGSRIRKVLDSWKCVDIEGNPLLVENLSGKLTRVQGYRGTVCEINNDENKGKRLEYLVNRINSKKLPELIKAEAAMLNLKAEVQSLIQHLHWKDFEILVELLFTRSGWQRLSTLETTENFIDLSLLMPVNGKRAFVQIKSSATLKTLSEYIAGFESMEQYDEMYFAVHTPNASLRDYLTEDKVTILGLEQIASLVIETGVINWLMQKAS